MPGRWGGVNGGQNERYGSCRATLVSSECRSERIERRQQTALVRSKDRSSNAPLIASGRL